MKRNDCLKKQTRLLPSIIIVQIRIYKIKDERNALFNTSPPLALKSNLLEFTTFTAELHQGHVISLPNIIQQQQ